MTLPVALIIVAVVVVLAVVILFALSKREHVWAALSLHRLTFVLEARDRRPPARARRTRRSTK
jgi:hypothetical protein